MGDGSASLYGSNRNGREIQSGRGISSDGTGLPHGHFLAELQLCKRWVTEQFPDIDVKKLMVESPSGSNKGSNREDLEEDEDLASLP